MQMIKWQNGGLGQVGLWLVAGGGKWLMGQQQQWQAGSVIAVSWPQILNIPIEIGCEMSPGMGNGKQVYPKVCSK